MKTCFFITPIGEENSHDRQRSDFLFRYLLEPVFKKYDIEVIRADKINQPTSLNNEIFKNIFFADFVVSDLSNNNPNVFYETAVRHCTNKLIIHIAQIDQQLPFDIKDFYTIFVNHADVNSLKEAEKKIDEILNRAIKYPETKNYNPITIFTELNNININFSQSQSKESLLNEVKDILSKVITEIQDMKPLIQKTPIQKTSTWTGRWLSNAGIINLVEEENHISGEYQYHSAKYIGQIRGRVIDNIFFFDWNWIDGSMKGFGFFIKSLNTNTFEGGWFYDNDSKDREKIIKLVKEGNGNIIPGYYSWIIYGKTEQY